MAAEGRPSPVHKGESASVQESRGQEMRTIWIYTHVHVTGTCTVNMYLIFRMKMHLQQQFLNWLNCFQTKYLLVIVSLHKDKEAELRHYKYIYHWLHVSVFVWTVVESEHQQCFLHQPGDHHPTAQWDLLQPAHPRTQRKGNNPRTVLFLACMCISYIVSTKSNWREIQMNCIFLSFQIFCLKGITNLENRKEWPLSVLRSVLQDLIAETPGDLLAR